MLLNNMNNYIYQYLINGISKAARTSRKKSLVLETESKDFLLTFTILYLFFLNDLG